MNTATITPKYVNQPKPGGKMGSIKDPAGELWLVEPGLLGSFRVGAPIAVEWAPIKFTDGTERKKITGVVHGAAPQTNGRASAMGNDAGREIFITGVVGRAMGSGKFAAADIKELVTNAILGWGLVTAPKKAPPEAGLDDAIPF